MLDGVQRKKLCKIKIILAHYNLHAVKTFPILPDRSEAGKLHYIVSLHVTRISTRRGQSTSPSIFVSVRKTPRGDGRDFNGYPLAIGRVAQGTLDFHNVNK